jgi:hypothetical protein
MQAMMSRNWATAHMARAQQRPKLSRAGVEEMGHEQIEAVRKYRDDNPNAKSPCAISPGKYDDGHINQRLEQVQKAKMRNKESRYSQG